MVLTKSPLVMDLGKINFPKSTVSSLAKGKSSQSSAMSPVIIAPAKPVSSPILEAVCSDISSPKVTPPPSPKASLNPDPPLVSRPSWNEVVSAGKVVPKPLTFVEPILADDNTTLCIPPEILAIGQKKYSLCLIGQFLGNIPKLGFMTDILNKLWGRDGSISIAQYKEGLFLFQFPTEAAYNHALYGRNWHVGGSPLVLQPWSSSFQKRDPASSIFPVWVQLRNIPLELLTHEGLSYLASTIGSPLRADQDCSKLFKGDSANLYINVDFSKPLKQELVVDMCSEKVVIPVVYSWRPEQCVYCHTWGHAETICLKKKLTQKWVPKASKEVVSTVAVQVPCSLSSSVPDGSAASHNHSGPRADGCPVDGVGGSVPEHIVPVVKSNEVKPSIKL
ncbi:hypothetical protein Tsubulata_037216 [Turnera subulata]|uniref:DUF4283 domain-containing protein n=1 Tax=Turnera subulata TaxID=218843 RepID=A0A9Q0JJ89_9ROSI|nr:hypothetical protein Tsubulata_037216 [Turnera subulata]